MTTNIELKTNLKETSKGFDSSSLIKWIFRIFCCAVLALIIVLGMYWFFLGNGNEISTDIQIWAHFGDYVGGVLNAIFSFLALLALLLTLNIQNQQLIRSKDDAKEQAEHYEREFKRIDFHRLIEKLAERINRNYKEKYIYLTLDPGNFYQVSLFQVILKGAVPRENLDLARMKNDYFNKQSTTFNTIWMIENDLKRLYFYIKQYEILSQYNGSPIQNFYKAEFEDLIIALFENDWLSDSNNEIVFREFIFTN